MLVEEIDHLKLLQAESDKRVSVLKTRQVEIRPSNKQLEKLVSIARDFRQPLSSVSGYADILLSESSVSEEVDFPTVKSLVELTGGHIRVDSEENQVAIFNVLLPLLPIDAQAEPLRDINA
jgi:signal transduction histidine kinase